MSGGVGLQIPKRQSKTIHQGWEHQVWGSRQTLVISMWSSSVFWKDSLSVIHIPFTFQVFFSFQVKSTFIINCSIVFTEHNHQELCFLWRHRFTASPSCNSSPSLQLGKPEGQHRHFSRAITLPPTLQIILDSVSLRKETLWTTDSVCRITDSKNL